MKNFLNNLRRIAAGFTLATFNTCNRETQRQINFLGMTLLTVPTVTGTIIGLSAYLLTGSVFLGISFFCLLVVLGYLIDRVYTDRRQEGTAKWVRVLRPFCTLLTVVLMAIFLEPIVFHQDIFNETKSRFETKIQEQAAELMRSVKADKEAVLLVDEQLQAVSNKTVKLLEEAYLEMAEGKNTGKIGPGPVYDAILDHIVKVKTQATADSIRLREKATRHMAIIQTTTLKADSIAGLSFDFATVTLPDQLDVLKYFVIDQKRYSVFLCLLAILAFSLVVELLPVSYRSFILNEAEIHRVNTLLATDNTQEQTHKSAVRKLEIDESVRADTVRIISDVDTQVYRTKLSGKTKCHEVRVTYVRKRLCSTLDGIVGVKQDYLERLPHIPEEGLETARHGYIVALTKIYDSIEENFDPQPDTEDATV